METGSEQGGGAKGRLLAVAEGLLMRRGVQCVTIREITTEAGVSVSMVNYYFGSRIGLVRAVLERRLGELNKARVQRLDELARSEVVHGMAPTVDTVLRAFLETTCAYRWDGGTVRELLRVLKDQTAADLRQVRHGVLGLHGSMSTRVFETLSRALPYIVQEKLWWRWQVAMGAVEQAIDIAGEGAEEGETTVADLVEILVPLLTVGGGAVGHNCEAAHCAPSSASPIRRGGQTARFPLEQ